MLAYTDSCTNAPFRDNRNWLFDVIYDRRVPETRSLRVPIPVRPGAKPWIIEGERAEVRDHDERVLKTALEVVRRVLRDDSNASFRISRRGHRFIALHGDDGLIVPNLTQLSSGETALLNLFLSILRDFEAAGAIRVFTDIVSGKRFDRPALAELIDHARPGDRLCIIRLDRLGRSLRELLETVDGLKARGIHLISLEERLDTSSAAGELVFHVFGSIAHFERRLISERTRDGIAAARKRGRTPGRPPLDPETVSAAEKLIAAGLSPARAAKQLGIGRATAYRIAKALR